MRVRLAVAALVKSVFIQVQENMAAEASGINMGRLIVAFIEDNATMSSIRYFENQLSYFVQKSKEVDHIKLISLRQISLLIALKYIYQSQCILNQYKEIGRKPAPLAMPKKFLKFVTLSQTTILDSSEP